MAVSTGRRTRVKKGGGEEGVSTGSRTRGQQWRRCDEQGGSGGHGYLALGGLPPGQVRLGGSRGKTCAATWLAPARAAPPPPRPPPPRSPAASTTGPSCPSLARHTQTAPPRASDH